jgi:hypothetical protein
VDDLAVGGEPGAGFMCMVADGVDTVDLDALNPSFSNGRLKMAKLRFFLHVSWFEFLQVTHFQRPDFSTDAV